MWPFKKKEKKNQDNEQKHVIVPNTPILPGSPAIPVIPTIQPEPEVSDKPKESIETEEPIESKESIEPKESIDFESMTVVELKALAKERGLEGYSTLKKAELIDLLK